MIQGAVVGFIATAADDLVVVFREVDVLRPAEGDDDREADGHLGRRDGDDEEHEDLRVVVRQLVHEVEAGERHQREIRGVQHELEAHEDDDDAAAQKHTRKPDREEQAADEKEIGEGRFHQEAEKDLNREIRKSGTLCESFASFLPS